MPKGPCSVNGNLLRVDLSTGRITTETIDDGVQRDYIGGTILGSRYLYNEVKPGVQWDSPENIVFIGSGPITGTTMGGSGSVSIVTKGAMTGGATSTQANGFMGSYLKFSGYDHILITGQSPDWKYLYIHDGVAELRDARHLLGKDTWEVEAGLKVELGSGPRNMSVFSIGVAGENRVRFAVLVGDHGHVASKNGIGAVLGAKRLKAIAVAKGPGRIAVANPEKLREVSKEIWERDKKTQVYEWGTSNNFANAIAGGWLPVKNYTTNLFPEWVNFMGERYRREWNVKRNPCFACQTKHCNDIELPEGGEYAGYKGDEPEYECWSALGPQIGNTNNPRGAFVLSNEVDKYGLDVNEVGWILGWAMECYEKELLTRDQLDGIELTWGNVESARKLVRNIALRQGFGDLLAEGVKRASEKLGGEAAKCAIYTMKGSTPRGHDHRGRWPEMFDTAVSVTSTMETFTTGVQQADLYGVPPRQDPFNPLQIAEVEGKTKGAHQFEDSLVTCRFVTRCDIPLLCQGLEAAMGWDGYDFKEAFRAGRRAINLMRVFNLRHGLDPKLDRPSVRYGSVPTDGPAKGMTPVPQWDEMLRVYYTHMGWDPQTGVPLPETLIALGLPQAAKDVARLKR